MPRHKTVDHRGTLRCRKHQLKGDALTVERGQRRIRRDGKRKLAANVFCSAGCEFWSVHPEAIARSRALDAAAQGRAA